MPAREDESVFCARCHRELFPGNGDFFEVQVQAVADPYPPKLNTHDAAELRKEIERTIDELMLMSECEAMEGVAIRRVFHLCVFCFEQWIDAPVSG